VPLSLEHSKELLSIAYVYAVAGMARVNMGCDLRDYGVDGNFTRITHLPHRRRHINDGPRMNFQLKATTKAFLEGDSLVYDLESKTYNDFVHWAREQSAPTILLVLCLPPNLQEWIEHSEERLLLRRCCYYHKLQPSTEVANEDSTKRIFIPNQQLFTAEALHGLIDQVKNGVFYEAQ